MFEWLKFNRPDITWLKGPLQDGSYLWDTNLPDQEQIVNLINNYDPQWMPPMPVPESVTNQQLRSALVDISFGQNKPQLHPDAIKNFILSLPDPTKSKAFQLWEYSNEMKRDNPLLNQMAPQLGLTGQDLDQFFIYASTQ